MAAGLGNAYGEFAYPVAVGQSADTDRVVEAIDFSSESRMVNEPEDVSPQLGSGSEIEPTEYTSGPGRSDTPTPERCSTLSGDRRTRTRLSHFSNIT
ncbi:MAG: hypothetical protein HKN01_04350 [Acidimicrobiia bacterium]|nr:hypothetical protein [Acidimicrobiia bacterium]